MDAGPVVLDGGLSTALEERGHDLSTSLWSARLVREQPEEVVAAHRAFVDAGAQVVISASYQMSHAGYLAAGRTETNCDTDLAASVRLAREAAGGRALVAASVGPYGAHRADGSEYTGYPEVERAALREFHARRLEPLLAAGPDLVACETLPELAEGEVLVELLAEMAPGVPHWLSFTAGPGGRLAGGAPFAEAVTIGGADCIATGLNCTAPTLVDELLESAPGPGPFVVYPNSGAAYDPEGKTWTDAGTPVFSEGAVRGWVERGARLVGGCCGTSAAGVAAVAAALRP
ncbi:homocysteine S-methyltransferase [Phycicoccus avicenniae]|uniref:homocysteine S-methyltransferase n=1 Tax=Phycicoccus avicenniae TaxID=2828860 RepID=UPI003D2C0139